MKHLRYFEDTIDDNLNQPQIGDYVLMKTKQEDIKEYIDTHIGQINYMDNQSVSVKYENVPEDIVKLQIFDYEKWSDTVKINNVRTFNIGQIIEFAPTIEELKQKLLKDKYNI
jgi:hypothetical protein